MTGRWRLSGRSSRVDASWRIHAFEYEKEWSRVTLELESRVNTTRGASSRPLSVTPVAMVKFLKVRNESNARDRVDAPRVGVGVGVGVGRERGRRPRPIGAVADRRPSTLARDRGANGGARGAREARTNSREIVLTRSFLHHSPVRLSSCFKAATRARRRSSSRTSMTAALRTRMGTRSCAVSPRSRARYESMRRVISSAYHALGLSTGRRGRAHARSMIHRFRS